MSDKFSVAGSRSPDQWRKCGRKSSETANKLFRAGDDRIASIEDANNSGSGFYELARLSELTRR